MQDDLLSISGALLLTAGVLTHGVDYPTSNGGFIKGIRYSVRAQFRYLMSTEFGRAWVSDSFVDRPSSRADISARVVKRMQEASGTYVMFSQLYDVLYRSTNVEGRAGWRMLHEVPRQWIRQTLQTTDDVLWMPSRGGGNTACVVAVGFEFGKIDPEQACSLLPTVWASYPRIPISSL